MFIEALVWELSTAVGPAVVPITEDPRIGDIGRQQIPQPVNATSRPSSLSMAIETVDGDDARVIRSPSYQPICIKAARRIR